MPLKYEVAMKVRQVNICTTHTTQQSYNIFLSLATLFQFNY